MRPVGSRSIWRGSARLSDGREVVYYDEHPDSGRADVADTRPATAGAATAGAATAGAATAGAGRTAAVSSTIWWRTRRWPGCGSSRGTSTGGFAPEAARWPYEVRFCPVPRVPDLPALSDAQRDAFGELCLPVLRGLDRIFGAPLPYVAAWHQAPAARADSAGGRALFGAHLQVFSVQRAPGKLKYLAGTESGMDVWINDVAPEDAARTIREAL